MPTSKTDTENNVQIVAYDLILLITVVTKFHKIVHTASHHMQKDIT